MGDPIDQAVAKREGCFAVDDENVGRTRGACRTSDETAGMICHVHTIVIGPQGIDTVSPLKYAFPAEKSRRIHLVPGDTVTTFHSPERMI